MKDKLIYGGWGCLYLLCVGLGFVKNPQGPGKVLLVLTALIFFLPGFYLLFSGMDKPGRKIRIRWISIISLGLTLILLLANFLSVRASAAVGHVLYELLILVSAPMICGQYWVMSLFLWACLLMATFLKKPFRSC